MKKNKIAFIVGTLSKGGVERQLNYMVSNLVQLDNDIEILCFSKGEYWEKKLIDLGAKFHFIRETNSKFIKIYLLYKIIRSRKIKIIYSTHFYTNIYATIVGSLLGIPVLTSVRSDFINEQKKIGKLFTYLSIAFSSVTIANSKYAMNEGSYRFKNHNWVLLPNAVDTKEFSMKSRSNDNLEKNDKNIKILIVGRLTRVKRIDFFLEIVSELKKISVFKNKITSLIAGTGRENEDLFNELVKKSKNLKLNKNDLIFLGDVVEMSDLYNDSDILVLTSEYEGLPNCILEAMASGLPVVANDVGGVSELVLDDETGFLIEPFNKIQFIDKISMLINNKKKRLEMGKKARSHIKEKFSIVKNKKILKNIVEKIVV